MLTLVKYLGYLFQEVYDHCNIFGHFRPKMYAPIEQIVVT